MKAKQYIYRNLHRGDFSVKYRGLVHDRISIAIAENVTFKVSEAGRQEVLRTGRKNVHAYAVCDSYNHVSMPQPLADVITYNPRAAGTFTCKGQPIAFAEKVMFQSGKLYRLR